MSPLLVLLTLVSRSPRYFATCVLFAIVMFCLVPIPLGLATRAFFDALAAGPAGLNVWSAIAAIVTLQLVEALADPVLRNPWNSLQQRSQVLLRRNLFDAILRGFGRVGLPTSIGDTLSRLRDDPEHIADGLDALCDLIGRTCFAVFAAVVMWQINALLTTILLLPLLLSSVVTEALGTRVLTYRAAARAATGRVTGFLAELLSAQQALKVAGAEPFALARLVALGDVRRRVAVRDRVFEHALDAFSINAVHLGTGLVLLVGAQAITDGTFTIGDLALFVVYLDQLTWYPAEIGRLLSDLKRTEVSFGRLREVAPGAPAAALVMSEPSPPAPRPERERLLGLSVRDLSYQYPGSGGGISNVSFSLERGSFTVLSGRIGAGKSTLVQVLLGLLPRADGEIRWNGQLVEEPAVFFVPPRTAYTPQVPRLLSTSLRENVALGRHVDEAALRASVRAAVLEPDVAGLEHGLETQVGPRGMKLSGGQVLRAAAARMFVHDAELLVLDDLSSALDADTEAELWARLFARGRDVTCLVVSHRPAALRRADQVLQLVDGRLVASTGM